MKIKKIKPLFTSIVTTADKYDEESAKVRGIIDASKLVQGVKQYQTVVAVGTSVRDIKVGDIVYIDPTQYGRPRHDFNSLQAAEMKQKDNVVMEYNIPTVSMEGKEYLFLQDRDIKFIVEEHEDIEVPDTPKGSKKIYLPPKDLLVS